MNPENRIKKLKKELKKLKSIVKSDTIILTDVCNPNLRAEISLRDGVLLIEKILTEVIPPTEKREIIIKDNL